MESSKEELERTHEKLQVIILELIDAEISDDPTVVREELSRRISEAGLNVPRTSG